ncbi:MAG: hypothetical protein ACYS5W_18015 [Planctomycetota bacterium]|jgi:hypothetical protein
MHRILNALVLSTLISTPAAAQLLGTIEANTTTKDIVRCVQTTNDGLVLTADGNMWALVYEKISASGIGYLELRYSTDQGAKWIDNNYQVQGGKVQTSSLASMCLARNGNLIHLLWPAITGKGGANQYYSTYYQAFDVSKKAFVGNPELIADGYGANNQFYGHCIAETGEGHLVAAITGHRSGGLGLTGWSCGLWIKKKSATGWPTNGIKVNTGSGVTPSMDVVGERVHLTMRDTTGGYGPIYRRYNVKTNQFEVGATRCWPSSQGTVVGAGNIYGFVIDVNGGKWLLWPEGVVSGNKNAALNLSYAAPGKGDAQNDWAKNELFKDAKIKGGNSSERFYGLARAIGNQVLIFYSKPSENFNTLYYEIWSGGKALLPKPITLSATTTTNRFEWVSGVRRRHNGHSPMVFTWGLRTASTNSGQVDIWRIGGRGFYTVYGSGCQGNLGDEPQVTANGRPSQGSTNTVTWSGMPKSAQSWLGIGVNAVTPIPMNMFGAPMCTLDTDLLVAVFGGSTTPAGTYVFSANVPSSPSFLGAGVQFQVLSAALGSPGGVISSPAVAWRF